MDAPTTLVSVSVHHASDEKKTRYTLTRNTTTPVPLPPTPVASAEDCPYHQRWWRCFKVFMPIAAILSGVAAFGVEYAIITPRKREIMAYSDAIILAFFAIGVAVWAGGMFLGYLAMRMYLDMATPSEKTYARECAVRYNPAVICANDDPPTLNNYLARIYETLFGDVSSICAVRVDAERACLVTTARAGSKLEEIVEKLWYFPLVVVESQEV
jgi:hypothetical protein